MSATFDYKDINLVPKKCIVDSRSECDVSVRLGKHVFLLPIVPANMECVINEELAIELAKNSYFYIMHRFNTDVVKFIQKMRSNNLFSSISIGVNTYSYELLSCLSELDLIPDYITIDIAHGHSVKMQKMLHFIRNNTKYDNTFVIAGNVCTKEAVIDLKSWGADAIKVGIGNGSVCTTYPTTGFGTKDIQASIVKECCSIDKDIVIIADGGITQMCDVTKSLAMGARMAMLGGMLTGFKESPGKLVMNTDNKLYQEFYGSASEHSKKFIDDKKNKNIEGTTKLIPFKNKSIFDFYRECKEALQSSISYGGGNTLECLRSVEYIIKS